MKIKRVLAFNLPVMKNMAVLKACQETNAEFKLVKPENLHKTLGSLAGILGIDENPGEYDIPGNNHYENELIVFAGFDNSEMENFISKYRKNGVSDPKIKVMLTEYNALWSPAFLLEQIKKEIAENNNK